MGQRNPSHQLIGRSGGKHPIHPKLVVQIGCRIISLAHPPYHDQVIINQWNRNRSRNSYDWNLMKFVVSFWTFRRNSPGRFLEPFCCRRIHSPMATTGLRLHIIIVLSSVRLIYMLYLLRLCGYVILVAIRYSIIPFIIPVIIRYKCINYNSMTSMTVLGGSSQLVSG